MPVNTELIKHLKGLSEKSKRSNSPYGHLFTNETLVNLAIPEIEAQRKRMPKGVGLVIGSGGKATWILLIIYQLIKELPFNLQHLKEQRLNKYFQESM